SRNRRRRQRHRLHGDADEWTPNVTARQEVVDYRINNRGGKTGRAPAGQCRVVHADDAARRGNERSAGEAIVHGEVEPQYAVEAAPLRVAPAIDDRADDS